MININFDLNIIIKLLFLYNKKIIIYFIKNNRKKYSNLIMNKNCNR